MNSPRSNLIDLSQIHIVVLINYVRRHHVLTFKEIDKRVGKLTILVSTPMEGDRNWEPQWDGLDVRVQKNWTVTLNRSAGFEEKNYIHFPMDTVKQLRELRPDIVFSYEMGMRSLLCGVSRIFNRETPLILVGNMAESLEKNRGLMRKTMRTLIKSRVDYYTYNGPSCKRYLESLGLDKSKLFYFPYCFDPEKTYTGPKTFSTDGTKRLLSCGALSERKAILPFVQILSQYCGMHPATKVELTIAGDGPLRSKVEACAQPNLKLNLMGNCEPQQLRNCYKEADIVVFPSLGDEWGLVPVEAWTSGVPVIGSSSAQSVESICEHGQNGWLIMPDAQDETLEVLDQAIGKSADELELMSQNARESVAAYSATGSANQFCKITNHAIHARICGNASSQVKLAASDKTKPVSPDSLIHNSNARRKPGNPIASMSLDLDNKWSYLKSHDDSRWEALPSYLSLVVPRILRVLDDLDMKITFFVVGQDAVIEENFNAIKLLADSGHEIANHSFHHEPRLHLYTPEQLEQEFEFSEAAIEKLTGIRTIGFRGPGFSLSDQTLKTLVRRGYEYDCTTFPTYLAPMARAYYFMTGSFTSKQKKDREAMFGKFSDGFMPNQPYLWSTENKQLLEIPVSTFPGFKVPIHATYLQYLASFSELAATTYWSSALAAFQLAGGSPSFLLHPLDFIGGDEEPDLSFFPAMKVDSKIKLRRMYKFLGMLRNSFDIVPMKEFAALTINQQLHRRSIELARTGVS